MNTGRFGILGSDPELLQEIRTTFRQAGHKLLTVLCLSDARQLLAGNLFDGFILDLDCGIEEGLAMVKTLRQEGTTSFIICMSNLKDSNLVIETLQAGADSFVSKDSDRREFFLRLNRHFQKKFRKLSDPGSGLKLETEQRSVSNKGKSVKLSVSEFKIMEYLLKNPDKLCSPVEILSHIGDSKVLDSEIAVQRRLKFIKEKLAQVGADSYLNLNNLGSDSLLRVV